MSDAAINPATFLRRLDRVQQAWKDAGGDASLAAVDALLIVAGGSDEDNPYKKSTAFQTWLLGYEFPSSFMLVTQGKIVFLAGSSRTKIVEPIKAEARSQGVEIQILTRGKDAAENEKLWEEAFQSMQGKKIGICVKDKFNGKFVDEWEAFLSKDNRKQSYNSIDVAPALASIMAVKENDEIVSQTLGAKASIRLMHSFVDEMQEVIDSEKKITHEKLSEKIEGQLELAKVWKSFDTGMKAKYDSSLSEWCYTPIIQSGGDYDLRPSAQSDDQRLKPGVILCSIGIRYKSYCSNVSRTFIIDPDQTQKDNMAFLNKLQAFVMEQMKDGVHFNDVHAAAIEKIQQDKPDLADHLAKSLGFLMGIEFKESTYNLTGKCMKQLKTNMVFCLSLGFQGLKDPKDSKKTYALLLADTIMIGEQGAKALSTGLKGTEETMFQLNDEPDPKSKAKANGRANGSTQKGGREAARTQATVTKSKLRQNNAGQNEAQDRRKEHQADLARRKQEEGLARFEEGANQAETKEKQWKKFESYVRESQLPDGVRDLQIVVDHRRSTVVLPINGYAVPFHIKCIKSAIKQEEGEHTVIRIMFITPGQLIGKKEDTPFEDIGANFIRALTYRSADNYRFSEIHKEITELKRESVKRENEKKTLADLVDQERLQEGRRGRLHDTWLRPPFEGKRSTGDVEIHQNGIRWASRARSDHKLDILFSNMKHLFFQPCDNELIVVIHVHLNNPIMLGKKKVKDVQFMREASENAFDETGNRRRRRQHEEDEIQMEQEERRQRGALNKEFKSFADKIADASGRRVEVDIPFRELSFQGVPFRTNVLLQPTTDCLVHLSETPFLCVTLADIEVAHLERVQYGLKNFDMVFVFKDFNRPPVHINTIPSEDLENVKDWLNSCDIATSEGPVNLNWGQIMKTVNEDPFEFFNEGGWGFLNNETDSDDSGDDSSDGSAFELDSDDKGAASESESNYSDDNSASAGDYSAEEESASAEDEDAEEEESEEERPKKKKK